MRRWRLPCCRRDDDEARGDREHRPVPVAAVALLLGTIGAMLVFTDLIVRGPYAQIDAAKSTDSEPDRPHD